MTTILKKAHHILRNLVIKEVSGVDRGAGEGVKVLLSKRAKTVAPEVAAYMKRTDANGTFPIANAEDLVLALKAWDHVKSKVKDPAALKKHIIERATVIKAELPDMWKISHAAFLEAVAPAVVKAMPALPADAAAELASFIAKGIGDSEPETGAKLFDEALKNKEVTEEFYQEFWESTDTLRESIVSILCDDGADKAKLIAETLSQFSDHLRGVLPTEMEKSLAAGFAASLGGARQEGVQVMDELKKSLGLPATATDAEVIKALDAANKASAAELAKRVSPLNDAELVYVSKMDAGARADFQKLSPEDRAKQMKEKPSDDDEDKKKLEKALASGDAFKAEDGTILTKRDFGTEAGFNFAKSAAARMASQAADIAKGREAGEVLVFAKRATDLGFQDTFGETLRKAYKGEAESITKLETEIKAMREQIRVGKLFEASGHGGSAATGKGYDQIVAKAHELMKVEKGLSEAQAFTKVYTAPAAYGMEAAVDLYKREKTGAQ